MMESILITPPGSPLEGKPVLPSSKSESNRALMINRYSGGRVQIENLSDASDTQTLSRLLNQESPDYDARDAGTTFRFLTSLLAFTKPGTTLTGSDRMKQRPIGILVDALRNLGCQIRFLEKEGYPPLRFEGFTWSGKNEIDIDATISSQYISSLMMAAPTLPEGLKINLLDTVSSLPYLKMTWSLMQQCGIQGEFTGEAFHIPPQEYKKGTLSVESDWSAAGYWFGMAALAPRGAELFLSGLRPKSLQGDSEVEKITRLWGVNTHYSEKGVMLSRSGVAQAPETLEQDFLHCPDLGQTIMVLCALSGTEARFTGLQSLAIKETNRLLAVKTELAKVGFRMEIDEIAGTCFIPGGQKPVWQGISTFDTYEDHRMAMSLSLVAVASGEQIRILEPTVVKKSYPRFWEALASCAFGISES